VVLVVLVQQLQVQCLLPRLPQALAQRGSVHRLLLASPVLQPPKTWPCLAPTLA